MPCTAKGLLHSYPHWQGSAARQGACCAACMRMLAGMQSDRSCCQVYFVWPASLCVMCLASLPVATHSRSVLPAGRYFKACRAAAAAEKWQSCGLQADAVRCAKLGKSAQCHSQICCASCRRMLQGVQSYCKTRGLPLDLEQRLLQVGICVLEVTALSVQNRCMCTWCCGPSRM